jgi:hypothetical protein
MDVVPSIAGSTLAVRPRGMRYAIPGSIVDYYFSADTIVVSPCNGTPTAHIWNGTTFRLRRWRSRGGRDEGTRTKTYGL